MGRGCSSVYFLRRNCPWSNREQYVNWAEYVGEGFGLALVVWVFVWGMTIPFRIFLRLLGL